jgi:hypothetical protein
MIPKGQQLFTLGDQLNPSAFVAATVRESTSAGVGFDQVSFEDGAHGTTALRDAAGGAACGAIRFADGSLRCTPWNLAPSGGNFSNSSCSAPALVTSAGCDAPSLGVTGSVATDTCEPGYALVQVGPVLNTYYSGSACTPVAVSPAQLAYSAGAAVADSTFPLGQPALAGSGRLQQTVLSWPSGLRSSYRWFDTQLNEYCSWYGHSADTSRACAVSTPGLNLLPGYYADFRCSQPLAATTSPASACAPKYVATATDPSTYAPRVLAVNGRHSGAVYTGTPESCTMLTTSLSGYFLFDVGGEVPTSSLAQVSQTLE